MSNHEQVPTKKIKILFRHRSMEMGGVEKVLLSLLNNLDQSKFEMTVLLSLDQGELRNDFPTHVKKSVLAKGKENFHKNKFIQKIQLVARRFKLEFLRQYPQLIDKLYLNETFDVEIAMTYNDFQPVLNSSNKNSKKIAWFHSEINEPKLQPLVPKILGQLTQFNHLVHCAENIQKLLHEHYPNLNFPPESVIVNAIPIADIKAKASTDTVEMPTEPVFVGVGRLHSRKGFHKLMEAHARLISDGYQHSVVIIGDGEERANLQEQQKKLGVEKTFLLKGSQINPYSYIKNADYFIMPSESEAWPLVIAEALILQKPIIATKVGDVEKMIEHRKTGFLINYNTGDIYNAMKEFLTDKGLVADITNNLADMEENFDNTKIFNAVEDLILNLAYSKR